MNNFPNKFRTNNNNYYSQNYHKILKSIVLPKLLVDGKSIVINMKMLMKLFNFDCQNSF